MTTPTDVAVALGRADEALARIALLETRVADLTESVNTAVGTMMPKVEALLSARGNEEDPIASGSTLSTNPTPSTSLLEMAESGDGESILRILAERHTDIRDLQRTEYGDTALHVAASRGHLKAVIALLGAVKIDAHGHKMRTPLHSAAAHGHLRVAQRLLDMGATVNAKDGSGTTALELAVAEGHCSVVELLLNRGASATQRNRAGECVLRYAAEGGQADTVRLLLYRGAASDSEQVQYGLRNAKSAAVVWAFVDVVPDAVRGDAGRYGLVAAGCYGRLEPLVALLDAGVHIDASDGLYQTALFLAARNGHIPCVRELLRRGANVNASGTGGSTPLHEASQNGREECVRALLAAGASTTTKNNKGNTPVEVAATDAVHQLFLATSDQQ